MNYHLACSSAILCSFLATGCSTLAIDQTRDVSKSAIDYTESVNKILEDTKLYVIRMDSKQLTMSRSTEDSEQNKQRLTEKNKAMDKWIAVADQLRHQNILLQKYFTALQAMITDVENNDMSDSLSNISVSISNINENEAARRGKESHERMLRDSHKINLKGVSGSMVSRHYANKIRRILIRDREIIDQQIALHTVQLDLIESIYLRRAKLDNAEHYANNILGAYVSTSPNSMYEASSWAAARNKWFKDKKALGVFDAVRKANKDFRQAWQNILQGKKDVGAVKAILSDVDKFVDNAYQLHDSYHNPRTTNLYVIPPSR